MIHAGGFYLNREQIQWGPPHMMRPRDGKIWWSHWTVYVHGGRFPVGVAATLTEAKARVKGWKSALRSNPRQGWLK